MRKLAVIEVIGWASSFVLVLTLGRQVYRQWISGTSKGVSGWLFLGQAVASVGFLVYSVLISSWVFVVTNGALIVNALVGYTIVRIHRRREGDSTRSTSPAHRDETSPQANRS